jgi:hypothetical protein
MPHAKHQTSRRTKTPRLTELYNQIEALMPVLQEIVQPDAIAEAAQPYASAPTLIPDASPRYRFEKRGRESWAVLDSREGDALLALVKYKKGAQALIERLEAYERCIAQLTCLHATAPQVRADGRPALPSPP